MSPAAVALVGLLVRAGATDWRGWLAIALLLVGVCTLVLFAWFWSAGGVLVALAALIIVRQARAAVLPVDWSTWLLVLAFPAGTGTFLGLRALEVGPIDEYNDYPVAFVAGAVVAALLFAAALVRLGRWLSREVPVDRRDHPVDGRDIRVA